MYSFIMTLEALGGLIVTIGLLYQYANIVAPKVMTISTRPKTQPRQSFIARLYKEAKRHRRNSINSEIEYNVLLQKYNAVVKELEAEKDRANNLYELTQRQYKEWHKRTYVKVKPRSRKVRLLNINWNKDSKEIR